MFIGFHLPIVLRRTPAPSLWVFYRQMNSFAPEDIVFVCSDDYLRPYPDRPESTQDAQASCNYVVPSAERMKCYDIFRIDSGIFREIDTDGGLTAAWEHLLVQRFEPLERELAAIFSRIVRERNVEAVLAWGNTPSLEHVASSYGIPVIHSELGALSRRTTFRQRISISRESMGIRNVNAGMPPAKVMRRCDPFHL